MNEPILLQLLLAGFVNLLLLLFSAIPRSLMFTSASVF